MYILFLKWLIENCSIGFLILLLAMYDFKWGKKNKVNKFSHKLKRGLHKIIRKTFIIIIIIIIIYFLLNEEHFFYNESTYKYL